MIRLASRLTAGGGRESLVRLVLTGAGLAMAVTMLLFATVAFPALHAHDVRRGWTETSEDNRQPAQDEATTDPLLWRLTADRFDGRDLLRVDLAADGPDAPVPPGLDRLPGPGEIAVSPALQELLASTDPTLLADRFPGRVTATVGRDALASPEDLVVFVGHAPAELGARDEVLTVRSIESAPVSHDLTRIMRVVFVVGGVGLLIPVVVFVATATRLAAARRERRLAALRLAGATQGQVGLVSAVEAAIAAGGGTVVGFVAFLAIRPALARVPFDGASFYTSDLHLSPVWAAAVALGVPALAVGAAIVSLRRIRLSPLGVARRSRPARPTPRPLLLVVAGMALLAGIVTWDSAVRSSEVLTAYAAGAAFVVMILGIVLSGPWLTAVVARAVARFGRGTPSLLAARRLQDNPAAGFRAISGVILAVFVGTVFSGLGASILANQESFSSGLGRDVVAAAATPDFQDVPPPSAGPVEQVGPGTGLPRWTPLDADRTAGLVDDLVAVPGVEQVVTAHAFPEDSDLFMALIRTGAHVNIPVLVTCDGARVLGGGPCEGTTAVNLNGDLVEATGFDAPFTARDLDELPIVAVAAATDGSVAAVEQARTLLERGVPGATARTGRDVEAEAQREVRTMQRVSDIGLSVTLVIAGCSLAVAVAGAIVERQQPFTLLRLAGTRLSDLRRMVLTEAAAPLLMVAAASVGLGLAVAALVLATANGDQHFALPGPGYWVGLIGGLGVALLVVLTTLPLLNRLTALDSARFE